MELGTDMDRVLLGRTKDMKDLSVSALCSYQEYLAEGVSINDVEILWGGG